MLPRIVAIGAMRERETGFAPADLRYTRTVRTRVRSIGLLRAKARIGLLVGAMVHAADIQDRDGAPALLASTRYTFPWLRHVFADGGYTGPKLRKTLRKIGQWTLEIVKRSDAAKGFVLLPRRWVVERTFAWLGRNRRLAKDWRKSIESGEAWLLIASIQLLTRRIAKG